VLAEVGCSAIFASEWYTVFRLGQSSEIMFQSWDSCWWKINFSWKALA